MNSYLLEFPVLLWESLMTDLRHRGGSVRESGAFLLGREKNGLRCVEAWVPYDELDHQALSRGYVRLDTSAFTKLWAVCAEHGLTVIGDVHTHPRGPGQSRSDQTNPMISQSGHVAMIVPRYAQGVISPGDVSVNVYRGEKQWFNFFGQDARQRIRLV